MLANPAGDLEFKTARGKGRQTLSGTSFNTSAKIPREVFQTGQSRLVGDLMDGNLAAVPSGEVPPGDDDRLLFTLICLESSPPGQPVQREWLLLRRDRTLQVNGIPVLPIATLEPGSLIAAGRQRWLVTSLWRPAPHAVPDAVKDVDCPVCGAPLSLAPVVRCACGRYMHLEKPDQARALAEQSRRLGDHVGFIESFAADVSHEFRNPLASIRTATEMLAERRLAFSAGFTVDTAANALIRPMTVPSSPSSVAMLANVPR